MNIDTLDNKYAVNYSSLKQELNYIFRLLKNKLNKEDQLPLTKPNITNSLYLNTLEQLFKISPFERYILLLCVADELNPHIAKLLGKIQGNNLFNYPTLGLSLQVFPNPDLNIFSPQSSLQHWQLIEFGAGNNLSKSPLKIDTRILNYILGEDALDSQLTGIISPISNANLSNFLALSHVKLVEKLTNLWFNSHPLPILQLCGFDLNTNYTIASKTCEKIGLKLNLIKASHIPLNPQQRHQLQRRWQRESILTDSALLLDCQDYLVMDYVRENAISEFIDNNNTPLIIVSEKRKHSQTNAIVSFDVPKLTHEEQKTIWQTHLGAKINQLNGHLDTIAAQFNLNSKTIEATCYQINNSSDNLTEINFNEHIWQICRTQSRPHLDDLAQRIQSSAVWEDLVLPDLETKVLQGMAAHLRQRAKVYHNWGFAAQNSRGLGLSALFSGQSGTGKTLAAEVLANELRLDLYRIDLSSVVSKYIGETEKNLKRIFDAAETGGAILLFDEADALFGKRSQVKDSHDRHANIEVSYLLQRMEAYQGLAILTTNLKESLDQAFVRRIRFIINFPFPDVKARAKIWQRIFPLQTPTEGLKYDKLGNLSVTGGSIRNMALNAAILAADAGEKVMMKHILEATKTEYLKLERSLTNSEINGWI